MREARLIAAKMLSANVRELTFDPGVDHSFVPGQWVSLLIPNGDAEPLKRPYSIASAPRGDGRFDVAVTLVEGGPGSTFLHRMTVGDSVRMLEAQGLFVLEPVSRPVLMIGTGTGVAPLRSMLLAPGLLDAGHRVTLLFGNRTPSDILYRDDFERIALPTFRFVPTLSRAGDDWSGRRGWVQAHLAEMVNDLGTDIDVYVCGLTRMVKEVRRVLREELGVDRKRVHVERYD